LAVVGGARGSWRWVHRRMGRRTAVITMHGAFRPGGTSYNVYMVKGHMAWPAHSPTHVVSEAEHVERLLVVSRGEI